GVGLKTVIGEMPAVSRSAAVIWAVNWVVLTYVVLRELPLNRTTELPLKLVPVTVKSKVASPTVLLVGKMLPIVGAGLFTVKFKAGVDAPPPGVGFVTVTGMVPPINISEAAITAVTSVPPPFTVPAWSVAPNRTVAPLTKLPPLTAKVNVPLPAVALAGERLRVVGNGLFTVKFNAGMEAPPPGVGFVTVTGMVPPLNISDDAMTAVTWVPAPFTVPA